MKLLISEKPSVAMTYATLLEKEEGEKFAKKDGYLQGKNYTISWCVGHLVGLAMPEDYGWKKWSIDTLPLIPEKWKYRILERSKKQYKILEKLIKEADELINGTDAGREGELIYRLVVNKAGANKKPQKRLWLNSFVMEDMQKAWKKMGTGKDYNNLAAAALCRVKADWMLGMTLSRGYSIGTNVSGLSVGRVQTPTLALVVKRDYEVENWVQKFYYQLIATFGGVDFTYFEIDDFTKKSVNKFDLEKVLKDIKAKCDNKIGTLTEKQSKTRKEFPPKPFDLVALQKSANRRYGYKASDTLAYAQSLYEKKYITYPRTDSEYLPASMKKEAIALLGMLSNPKEKSLWDNPLEKKAFFNSKKVTDHFAILPTKITPKGLTQTEQNIYTLIRNRMVLAFLKPYIYEEVVMKMACEKSKFKAIVRIEKDKGYKALFQKSTPTPAPQIPSPIPPKTVEKEETKESKFEPSQTDKEGVLVNVNMEKGYTETIKPDKLTIVKREASPPKYYTEATLLTAMGTAGRKVEDEEKREAMKERGLGTPATKSSIIEIIKKRDYVKMEKKNIISTTKGRQLIKIVDTKVKSPEMTGEWEYKLKQIERGEYNARQFLSEIHGYVHSLTPSYTNKEMFVSDDPDAIKCPRCKKGYVRKLEKYWVCTRGKEACGFIIGKVFCGKKLTEKQMNKIANGETSDLIKGFKRKDGSTFQAKLKWFEERLCFVKG